MKNDLKNIESLESQIRDYILDNLSENKQISLSLDFVAESILTQNIDLKMPFKRKIEFWMLLWQTKRNKALLNLLILFIMTTLIVILITVFNFNSITTSNLPPVNFSQIDCEYLTEDTTGRIQKTAIDTTLIRFQKQEVVNTHNSNVLIRKNDTIDNLYITQTTIPLRPEYQPKKEKRFKYEPEPPTFNLSVKSGSYTKHIDTFYFDKYNKQLKRIIKNPIFISEYYEGQPFTDGFKDMVYFNYGKLLKELFGFVQYDDKIGYQKRKNDTIWYPFSDALLPIASRLYFNNTNCHYDSNYLIVDQIPQKAIETTVTPFYFRKYEVTNKEYKEFIKWVQASNGFEKASIFNPTLDTTIILKLNRDKKAKQKKSFYPIEIIKKHPDFYKAFNYEFFDKLKYQYDTINVFPDLTSWKTDFTFMYSDPFTNLYFQHPGYDDYPVVGISYWQALAFLDWKTHFHQQELDEKGIDYKIEYKLPSDIHWEIAAYTHPYNDEMKKETFVRYKKFLWRRIYSVGGKQNSDLKTSLRDNSMITDLSISEDGLQNWKNPVKKWFLKDVVFEGNYMMDGLFYPGKADRQDAKNCDECYYSALHLNDVGISWLDGNVSEWMLEDYQNYEKLLEMYLNYLEYSNEEEALLMKQFIEYFNSFNDKDGKLVRGCNFMDERFSRLYDINTAGINAKRFISPEKQHATIGFRYVVVVTKL